MNINSGVLKIVHNFNYNISDSYETKVQVVKNDIEQLKKSGYDGIVTNVCFYGNYLNDPDEWQLMLEKAEICKKNGMRLWIYDENGYPSGTAKTKTLNENPDCEARAAVMVHRILKKGEEGYFPLPKGHIKPISALGYYIDGDKATDNELNATPIKAKFDNIGSFCEKRAVAFSGHLLLEDKIHDHIPFEGNFFNYLSRMHIPGMDMLDSVPEKIWEKAFTPVR